MDDVPSPTLSSPSSKKNNGKIATYSIAVILSFCLVCLIAVIVIKTDVPSQKSEQITKKQLIVPAGQLAQYTDSYSSYDEVFVTKKDGSLDDRPNDLEELCLDWLYYQNKILEYTQAGQTKQADDARTSWNEINNWLNEYNESDVETMFSIIQEKSK